MFNEARPNKVRLQNIKFITLFCRILDIDKWSDVGEPYDVISCLNLLDRCDKPLSLLRDVKKALKPNTGRLVVAVVLPFSPCVESGKLMSHLKLEQSREERAARVELCREEMKAGQGNERAEQ